MVTRTPCRIFKNIVVPEPQNTISLGYQPGIALRIVIHGIRVLPAIEFDESILHRG
jgi:hypothetical protein